MLRKGRRVSATTQMTLGLEEGADALIGTLVREAIEWADGLPSNDLAPQERALVGMALEPGLKGKRRLERRRADEDDPFGRALRLLRSTVERRSMGQFFTPQPIVRVMVDWVKRQGPEQVVDAGCGTGRFAVACARALPKARVLAVDTDPVATLLCRAYARRHQLRNLQVLCADFLTDSLPLDRARTAFVGNPPYVRHHLLSPELKAWGARMSAQLGVPFSKLAGLHVYFFLATALLARARDVGCYITSSEWLDVRYGEGLRQLLRDHLGVLSVAVLAESEQAFEDAMTTAAITCFRVGSRRQQVRFAVVPEFTASERPLGAAAVCVDKLGGRWGPLLRGNGEGHRPAGWIRLGDIAAVHRGVATGANDFFVLTPGEASALGLAQCAMPVITAGKQVLDAGGQVSAQGCKRLLMLPQDIERLPGCTRTDALRYLAKGRAAGVPDRYLCRHRNPWWWLGNAQAPPIVASYMARRPPSFALNPDGALILNIAHGIFPKEPASPPQLARLVDALNRAAHTFVGNGRRYQGGLEKFEPREMEDLLIPPIEAPER